MFRGAEYTWEGIWEGLHIVGNFSLEATFEF